MKFLLIMLPFLLAFGPFDSPGGLVKEGNLSFETDNLDDALSSYDRALKITKDASAVEYNRANTLIKKGEVEEALKSYEKAASAADSTLKQRAYYNMGNALYNAGKFKEAAGAYKEALKADPKDKDAKTNLEMTLKKMQEQKQDSKKDGDDKNKDKNKDKDKEEKPQDGDSQPDKNDKDKDDQNKDKEKEKEAGQQDEGDDERKDQSEKDAGKEAEKKEGEMSKTDAERLLDSLGDRNIDLQTMKDMLKGGRPAKTEKDW